MCAFVLSKRSRQSVCAKRVQGFNIGNVSWVDWDALSFFSSFFLQGHLQPLSAHRLQQQLQLLRGTEDTRLHRRALGGFGRQGEPSRRTQVPWLADDGQWPPGRDEGQAREESAQGEEEKEELETEDSLETWTSCYLIDDKVHFLDSPTAVKFKAT